MEQGVMDAPLPIFFLQEIRYDITTLTVQLYTGDRPSAEVLFIAPRAFRTYDESDQWEYLTGFEGVPVMTTVEADCGVFLSKDAPYVVDYRAHAREQENEETFSCLIKTPQECVEVICFEEPIIIRL
jgi:hypothetical protein